MSDTPTTPAAASTSARLKFIVRSVSEVKDGFAIHAEPAIAGGGPENDAAFAKSVQPGGLLRIHTLTKEAAAFFSVGKHVFVDVSSAE